MSAFIDGAALFVSQLGVPMPVAQAFIALVAVSFAWAAGYLFIGAASKLPALTATAIMTITLARIAGCPEIVVCTPCGKSGGINPALLCASKAAGEATPI